jgi:predicted DNA-binding transcriptional regulator AlpA
MIGTDRTADTDIERVLTTLSALIEGDRVLDIRASALLLGISVDSFRRLSTRPDFPAPAMLGKRLTWRRRELLDWWEDERNRQRRSRCAL